MSKPVFVFVPGAWHTPDVYDQLISHLTPSGYESVKVILPSVGASPPTYDFTEDVDAVKATVNDLIKQEKDVVLVAHSYAGLVVGELPKELGKRDRQSKSLNGGIVRLVFIMAFLVPEGGQLAARGDISTLPPHITADVEAGTNTITPEDAKRIFYHDLPDQEAEKWAAKMVPKQSLGTFWSKTTTASWRSIPTTFVLCENDRSLSKAFCEMQIQAARESGECLIDRVEECDAGHFPMLSRVDWTVGVLRRAARESVV